MCCKRQWVRRVSQNLACTVRKLKHFQAVPCTSAPWRETHVIYGCCWHRICITASRCVLCLSSSLWILSICSSFGMSSGLPAWSLLFFCAVWYGWSLSYTSQSVRHGGVGAFRKGLFGELGKGDFKRKSEWLGTVSRWAGHMVSLSCWRWLESGSLVSAAQQIEMCMLTDCSPAQQGG